MISNDELIYFIELAYTLNFSRAAERIGISQPALSAAIKRIESSIGTSLFVRHKKELILTKAGTQLLAQANQLLQYWKIVRNRVLFAATAPEGIVRIGSHPSIALYIFSQFLPTLIHRFPKFELQLTLDLSRKIIVQILDLNIDVGIGPTLCLIHH